MTLTPFALKDTPALIEKVFPAQKISAEAQKERKAGAGQTLTALGSYWKGRKPLIMVRAIVLGCLFPATEDLQADLQVFEQLMAIDDLSFTRREPKLTPAQIATEITLANPWEFFDYTVPPGANSAEIAELTFPLKLPIKVRWKRGLPETEKQKIYGLALARLTYEEKVLLCRRPEELNPEDLYGPIWEAVNDHLGRFGVEAFSHSQLVEQLGILRFGQRPRVGDTFCGGGSIPFEAARLGCDVYASDLNPVACMLTWGALNIIGADAERRAEIDQAQKEVAAAVDAEITALGIEHNERGDRAKAYLYCLETRCPETGWMVPLAPSWIISKTRNVYAKLVPNPEQKRFEIEIISGATAKEMEAAKLGTVRDGNLVYQLEGKTYQTPIKTIRGDYKDPDTKANRNKLRQWELSDFKPRPDDIFQERLYCIQWITGETLGNSTQETYFAAVTDWDLANEAKVEKIVAENLSTWQEKGLVPDMAIEPGAKTDEPIRTRGWRYWHHLFNPRNLALLTIVRSKIDSITSFNLFDSINFNAKLCRWTSSHKRIAKDGSGKQVGGASDNATDVFSNQALNTFYNYAFRSLTGLSECLIANYHVREDILVHTDVINGDVRNINYNCDLFITDPPYADAVNYEEITEFFIAWLRKNPPAPFDQWIWDSRRALAIKGDGEAFRRGMTEAYTAMTQKMPDNGLQCVMFTHQDTSVWADMVSIFWAAGLQVISAWYIATETTSELKQGGYVQGTVTLLLRKRLIPAATFKQRLLPQIRKEVTAQMETMLHLNDQSQTHGETVFNDSDLQMAGYAAALKVLTQYTEVDGRDMTALALQPRQKGQKTVVDDIVDYAAEVANNLLIPERLKALNPEAWGVLKGVERFYLRMVSIEHSGATKLDNYQNFAKAFHIAYQPLMASVQPNKARLKTPKDFKPRELASGDFTGTLLSEILMGVQELLNDKDPKLVLDQIRSSLNETYFQKRPILLAMAQYLADMWTQDPELSQKAEIIANRIRNEGLGG